MKTCESINSEIKFCLVDKTEDGNFIIKEVDKDGNNLGEITVEELLGKYVGKKYTEIKIKYMKEI